MYQSAICVVPSGFMFGITSRMTSSRIRRISSVSPDTIRHTNNGAACPCATSEEWRPKSTQTTARPSRAMARAETSGNVVAIPPGQARAPRRCRDSAQGGRGYGRGDRSQAQRASLDGASDLHQRHAIRGGIERAQVAVDGFVAGELVVGAGLEAEHRAGAGSAGASARRQRQRQYRERQAGEKRSDEAHAGSGRRWRSRRARGRHARPGCRGSRRPR